MWEPIFGTKVQGDNDIHRSLNMGIWCIRPGEAYQIQHWALSMRPETLVMNVKWSRFFNIVSLSMIFVAETSSNRDRRQVLDSGLIGHEWLASFYRMWYPKSIVINALRVLWYWVMKSSRIRALILDMR